MVDQKKSQLLKSWARREQLKTGGLGLAFLLVGLALGSSSFAYKWSLSEKAERLRTEGMPVSATVTNLSSGASGRGSGPDKVDVSYVFRSRVYRDQVRCYEFSSCLQDPATPVTIWVDPESPDEFVMADGNVTGSLSFLTKWTYFPAGIFFAGTGGVLIVVSLTSNRKPIKRLSAQRAKRVRLARQGRAMEPQTKDESTHDDGGVGM